MDADKHGPLSMGELIYRVRFGLKPITDFANQELLELMDYNISQDVMDMCFTEIRDRRQQNLKASEESMT